MRTGERTEKRYLILMPFSWLFGLTVFLRNALYRLGWLPVWIIPVPSICVGNITVGGTGKTPHIEYLIDLLSPDYSVAVISRGYGRKSRGTLLAHAGHTALDIGDEPAQILAKHPSIPLVIDGNRKRGIKFLMRHYPGTEVLLMDDGFQHRPVQPGLSIVLMDYHRPLHRDHLLPYGRLREQRAAIQRAEVAFVTKCPANTAPSLKNHVAGQLQMKNNQKLYLTTFTYLNPVPVFKDTDSSRDAAVEADCCVLVTGIVNPRGLIEHIEKQNIRTIHLAFPDHHDFTGKDIRSISGIFAGLEDHRTFIFTTEKDAARLRQISVLIPESLRKFWYYIPVRVAFLNGDQQAFEAYIEHYVEKNSVKS